MSARTHSFPEGALGIPRRRLARLLGLPVPRTLEPRFLELEAEARQRFLASAQPAGWSADLGVASAGRGRVALDDGTVLAGPLPAQRIESLGAHRAVIAAVTLGAELDQSIAESWKSGRPDLGLFLDAWSAASVVEMLAQLRQELTAQHSKEHLAALGHSCPGFPGWPLEDQHQLFHSLRKVVPEAARALRLLDSGMLSPMRSVLGMFPLAVPNPEDPVQTSPCDTCTPEDCVCRRLFASMGSGYPATGM